VLAPSPPIAQHKHVYRAGDTADHHYHVRSGMFKTYAMNTAGDEYVTGFYFPGDLIGCSHTDGVYADSAVTLETGTVCALYAQNLSELCDIGLGPAFLELLADREAQTARHQFNLTQTRADVRLAGWLVQVSERISRLGWCPNRIPLPMSRTDLASYLGMTLECLSRVFARFNKDGLIRATRKHVDLLKPETIATFGYHAMH
jgi:CRP/FNR family transcriptional regulator